MVSQNTYNNIQSSFEISEISTNFNDPSEILKECFEKTNLIAYFKGVYDASRFFTEKFENNTYNNTTSIEEEDKYEVSIKDLVDYSISTCSMLKTKSANFSIKMLKEKFELKNEFEIIDYLRGKEDSIIFLLRAAKKIEQVFDTGTKVTLIRKQDPEINNLDYITIFINTSDLPISIARKKLKEFKGKWYYDKVDSINGRFIFNVT